MQERVFDFEQIEQEIEEIRELISEKKYTQVKTRLQELNVADIADIFEALAERFGLSERYISVRLFRARKGLKKALEKEGICDV